MINICDQCDDKCMKTFYCTCFCHHPNIDFRKGIIRNSKTICQNCGWVYTVDFNNGGWELRCERCGNWKEFED